MLNKIRTFFLSPYYAVPILFASAAAYLGGDDAVIACMLILAQLTALVLCLSDDPAPTLWPILSVIVLGTTMIGKTDLLMPYIPYALTVIPAAILHLCCYRKPLRPGVSLFGLLASSAAILLSGIGNTENTDYGDPTVLYYLLMMSAGLVLLYFVFSSNVKREHRYDPTEHFLSVLCFVGALTALIVFVNLLKWISGSEGSVNVQDYYALMPYRNTLANLLTLCLPAPFYFAGYAAKRNASHILLFLLGCIFYSAMLMTVARTAMIFGTVVLIVCLVYYLRGKSAWYLKLGSFLVVLLAISVFTISIYEPVCELFLSRLDGGIASTNEARWLLFKRSLTDFLSHPLFGIGFASSQNADLYAAEGCISWYHLYFPQIWGSLGLIGCMAFAFQMFIRLRLMFFRPNAISTAISLCYFGIFLYSQTDPGEFVPIPFAVLAILIFVLLEDRYERFSDGKLSSLLTRRDKRVS